MVVVNSGIMKQNIIDLLDGKTLKEVTFKYVKSLGVKHYFEADGASDDDAALVAKAAIKAEKFGQTLYFSVKAE